jgi:hypothetical protein
MLQRRTRDFAGTYRRAQHGEQLENVVAGLTDAAKRVTSENLLVTMHVGHLEVMSNVAGGEPLFVHRSGDAKAVLSASQTTRTSAEPQHCAMSCQTLIDASLISFISIRPSPTTLQRRFLERNSRRRMMCESVNPSSSGTAP